MAHTHRFYFPQRPARRFEKPGGLAGLLWPGKEERSLFHPQLLRGGAGCANVLNIIPYIGFLKPSAYACLQPPHPTSPRHAIPGWRGATLLTRLGEDAVFVTRCNFGGGGGCVQSSRCPRFVGPLRKRDRVFRCLQRGFRCLVFPH